MCYVNTFIHIPGTAAPILALVISGHYDRWNRLKSSNCQTRCVIHNKGLFPASYRSRAPYAKAWRAGINLSAGKALTTDR